ncbi:maleylpyruvate isomerase family mycothiol-dependent enzyme [Kribbella speibonae]|uniref:Maleylpyruvate isomerase family mycothiol-dependent enzyme n=1 Tax=Kribbella speibonae TaxID=1572660 RepID=A0ABY2A6F5_9ACTN|nr:maleylpyruvate isomerase family mycothiol-dependent enzyme [Kribbella speibonae]TCC22806.1 maleylpyruvate isomerase family mycothiol-dependent enzyme [Kribbella speibonae]
MNSAQWVVEGTALCRRALVDLDGPSLLPGWTRRQVAAHLSLNAEALSNLVHWARTGEERPMYSSADQRGKDIEVGALRPPGDLRAWFDESATNLSKAMDELTAEQWQAPVRTAQGRQVPATEIVWMRSREVMIHAVDLGAGVTFADLPTDFLQALSRDIRNKRGDAPEVRGPLPETTAYLAGRQYTNVHTLDGAPAQPLGPWL